MTEELGNLQHVFIFHEESGVCLYYHPFTDVKIDPQLISGFLSALTSFGGQYDDGITKKKKPKQGKAKGTPGLKELVYREYRILMGDSWPCKFAFLITGKGSDILRSKISGFIDHFMQKYDEALKDWKSNVRLFKDAGTMIVSELS